MNIKRSAVAMSVAAGLCGIASHPVQAQEANAAGEARLVVDLRDASLDDALNMIFKAVGDPTHSIDPAAKTFNIGTYHNQEPKAWNDIVRTLANMGNFSMRRDPGDGSWRIELRAAPTNPNFPGGMSPGMNPSGMNPSGMNNGTQPNITTFGARSMSSVRVSPQITPRRRTGNASGGTFVLIPVEHVYSGSIALLFEGGEILTTREFVLSTFDTGVGNNGTNTNSGTGGGLGTGAGAGTGGAGGGR